MSAMAGKRLLDKVCVITGSSSGLGRAIALAYAREGAHIVCSDLSPIARAPVPSERSVNTDELVRQQGQKSIFVAADVSEVEDMQNLISEATAEFGRVDVMVNNAGVSMESRQKPARIHETSQETWDTTMAVNATSVFLGCKYATAQMLKQDPLPNGDRGWIINLSSIFGIVGGHTNASYAASKAAVSNLTRTVALDYARDRIRCNAIGPGYTKTAIFKDTAQNMDRLERLEPLHPLGGLGVPEDIAGAAVFLASSEANWITGVTLPVDGGYTAQ